MVLVLAEFQAASKPGKATLMVRQLCLIFSYFSFSLSLSLSTIGFFKLQYWWLSRFKNCFLHAKVLGFLGGLVEPTWEKLNPKKKKKIFILPSVFGSGVVS